LKKQRRPEKRGEERGSNKGGKEKGKAKGGKARERRKRRNAFELEHFWCTRDDTGVSANAGTMSHTEGMRYARERGGRRGGERKKQFVIISSFSTPTRPHLLGP
jgi:hypothetical protein